MGIIIPTMQITTGNVATVNDAYDATKPYNGAKNPLGASVWIQDSTGSWNKYSYVRLNATTPPTHWYRVPVYWKDATRQVVTMVATEGYNGTATVAGYCLNTDTYLTNGNYILVQTYGYLADALVADSGAALDTIIGSVSSDTVSIGGVTYTFYVGRIAKDTAITTTQLGIDLTTPSGNQANVFITVEP